jgi:hypothetical protein
MSTLSRLPCCHVTTWQATSRCDDSSPPTRLPGWCSILSRSMKMIQRVEVVGTFQRPGTRTPPLVCSFFSFFPYRTNICLQLYYRLTTSRIHQHIRRTSTRHHDHSESTTMTKDVARGTRPPSGPHTDIATITTTMTPTLVCRYVTTPPYHNGMKNDQTRVYIPSFEPLVKFFLFFLFLLITNLVLYVFRDYILLDDELENRT